MLRMGTERRHAEFFVCRYNHDVHRHVQRYLIRIAHRGGCSPQPAGHLRSQPASAAQPATDASYPQRLTPDVYIRDSISDTGEPHTGSISASPDVILRPATVANPQAAYGNGSGTELNLAWIRSRGRARQLHLRPGFEPRHDYGHKHNGDGVLVTGLNAGDAEPLDIALSPC